MGFPVGSCFSSVTLMSARKAGRSDSRPGWPSTTCRAAMTSHGQSPARRRWGTVMASTVAAVPGRTWWTSKLANTADKTKRGWGGEEYLSIHDTRLLSALTTSAKQTQSKLLKRGDCHQSSCVTVLKLPFSGRVHIQTADVINACHMEPEKLVSSDMKRASVNFYPVSVMWEAKRCVHERTMKTRSVVIQPQVCADLHETDNKTSPHLSTRSPYG